MNLIDTHCHLYSEEFEGDIDAVINRAKAEGVTKFFLPAIDSSSMEAMLLLEEKYPNECIAMMGLHPCYVKENYKEELAIVEAQLEARSFAAVGEIGLDYYWDITFKQQQKEAFETQIDLALAYDLPIVIHSRESTGDCIEIVKKKQKGNLRGIFHCFGGSFEEARAITRLGFHLGIGGVVTYKKSALPDVLRQIPLASIVLETDAPYLAPVPYRGKRNESAYIPVIAEKLAEIYNLPVEEIGRITTANAATIFPPTA